MAVNARTGSFGVTQLLRKLGAGMFPLFRSHGNEPSFVSLICHPPCPPVAARAFFSSSVYHYTVALLMLVPERLAIFVRIAYSWINGEQH